MTSQAEVARLERRFRSEHRKFHDFERDPDSGAGVELRHLAYAYFSAKYDIDDPMATAAQFSAAARDARRYGSPVLQPLWEEWEREAAARQTS
jgi:hypothetical protein